MLKFFYLVLGGGLGTVFRYVLSGAVYRFSAVIFPWGTMAVNLLGSFIIGVLWELFQAGFISPNMRIFLFIGVLGGFTTFSSYSLETFNLIRDGEIKLALMNVVLSNILGIALVFIGSIVSKYFLNFK